MRRFTLILLIALLATVLQACGTVSNSSLAPAEESPTPAQASTPTPAPDPKAQAAGILQASAEAMKGMKSYHSVSEMSTDGTKVDTTTEMDWLATGAIRMRTTAARMEMESIIVDGKWYMKLSPDGEWQTNDFALPSGVAGEGGGAYAQMLEGLIKEWSKELDIQLLGSDTIDGVETEHLRFTMDGGQLSSLFSKALPMLANDTTGSLEDFKTPEPGTGTDAPDLSNLLKSFKATADMWIGKEDHYMRQMSMGMDMGALASAFQTPVPGQTPGADAPSSGFSKIHQVVKYSKFNEPIEIKPPI